MPGQLAFLPEYTILGPQPSTVGRLSAKPLSGFRATCTTSSAPLSSFLKHQEAVAQQKKHKIRSTGRDDGDIEVENVKDFAIGHQPFVFDVESCAKLCSDTGERCTHFSISLGPIWNKEEVPQVANPHFPLSFTPLAGAPGHCHLCHFASDSVLPSQVLRETPGMRSFVGFKNPEELMRVDDKSNVAPLVAAHGLGGPIQKSELYASGKESGALVANLRDPSRMPLHWKSYIHKPAGAAGTKFL